jgi:hypothetical protein
MPLLVSPTNRRKRAFRIGSMLIPENIDKDDSSAVLAHYSYVMGRLIGFYLTKPGDEFWDVLDDVLRATGRKWE